MFVIMLYQALEGLEVIAATLAIGFAVHSMVQGDGFTMALGIGSCAVVGGSHMVRRVMRNRSRR